MRIDSDNRYESSSIALLGNSAAYHQYTIHNAPFFQRGICIVNYIRV
jgi:hypothetical protein